jgi:aldehyde:ferredoxin oxidoreductase
MDQTLFTPQDISAFYEAITGRPASPSDLLRAGERVQNLERSFNLLHAGFGRADDLPPRKFVDIPVNKGVFAGEKIDPAGWNRMLDDYYRLHGWDAATGWPTAKCLSDLGLTDVAERLRQNGIDLA